jgi:hypothetical protein
MRARWKPLWTSPLPADPPTGAQVVGHWAGSPRPGGARPGPVWSRTAPALRSSATRDRSAGRARQGRSLPRPSRLVIANDDGGQLSLITARCRWVGTSEPDEAGHAVAVGQRVQREGLARGCLGVGQRVQGEALAYVEDARRGDGGEPCPMA